MTALEQILNSIINEDETTARKMLDAWFTESTKTHLTKLAESASEECEEEEKVEEAVVEAEETEEEAIEESEESEDELDEGIADLAEAFEKAQTPANVEGKEVGAGSKVAVNDKSTALQKKPAQRLAGDPVEIRAEEHKGFARETPPTVKSQKKAENNDAKAPTAAKKEGAALLNKSEGPVNDKSPVVAAKKKA